MLGDVNCQGGLAHRRTRRKHYQVTGLQTRRHAVQVIKAGRYARNVVGVVRHLLHPI